MSVDAYFADRPPEFRRIHDAVVAHLATLGPIVVDAVQVGILIKRARTFAELRPRRDRLVLSVLISQKLQHPRIARTVALRSGSRFAHFVHLFSEKDVDDEVRGWLTESYDDSPV